MNINEYLRERNIRFDGISHAPTMNASRLAQDLHVAGDSVAKTVLLRADEGYVIAVVPATRHVDLEAVKTLVAARKVELATEREAGQLFPDVELGVVPPIGSKYGIRTLVDVHLAACEFIVFEGLNHQEAIRLRFTDFEMLESPMEGMISQSGQAPKRLGV